MIKRDDIYCRHGTTWQRRWVGDNGGRYEWLSKNAIAWRDGHFYRLSMGGVLSPERHKTLLGAMDRALIGNRETA